MRTSIDALRTAAEAFRTTDRGCEKENEKSTRADGKKRSLAIVKDQREPPSERR
jgi:hypothetical protein